MAGRPKARAKLEAAAAAERVARGEVGEVTDDEPRPRLTRSGKVGNGVQPAFTSESARDARQVAIANAKRRKAIAELATDDAVRKGVELVIGMQMEELAFAASLPVGDPERQKIVLKLGEKVLDRAKGKPTQQVNLSGNVGLGLTLSQLLTRD